MSSKTNASQAPQKTSVHFKTDKDESIKACKFKFRARYQRLANKNIHKKHEAMNPLPCTSSLSSPLEDKLKEKSNQNLIISKNPYFLQNTCPSSPCPPINCV